MTDRVAQTQNLDVKTVSRPDGDGQGPAATHRVYVKPELIVLYQAEGRTPLQGAAGTVDDKVLFNNNEGRFNNSFYYSNS